MTKSNMKSETSERSRLPNFLLAGSLALPVLSLLLFHTVNVREFGRACFFLVPFRFFSRISEFSLTFPADFFIWTLRAAVGIIPIGVLGAGLLAGAGISSRIRILAAFPVGLGLVGLVFELLALLHLLNATMVGVTLAAALIVGLVPLLLQRGKPKAEPDTTAAGDPDRPSDLFRVLAWGIFGFLTWFSFQHALFYPPNYWDALIYYLYYSKLIFLEGGIPFPVDETGFPELVQCQVGLGLGANYPHLFLLWQAAVCRLFGEWNSFPGQWLPPIAGLATALLVYETVRLRWKSERMALWSLLLVQSVPYWQWYQNFVSDYALAVWLTVAATALLLQPRPHGFSALGALISIAIAGSHLNYLMATLWWFPLVAWFAMEREKKLHWKTWVLLIVGILLSSTWFIRNEIVTGNPVYAFFPEVFGGINIDPAVLRSCEIEWTLNGDGLSQVGDTLWERVAGSPRYFVFDGQTHHKWAALPLGWFVPGLLFLFSKRKVDLFQTSFFGYAAFLFFYQYVISGLYLYHVIPLVPLMVWIACDWMDRIRSQIALRRIHTLLIFLAAATVGAPAALMGGKMVRAEVVHTLHPGLPPTTFLREFLGAHFDLWRRMNASLPKNSVILTHENRYYYLRDDLKFLHLDDYRLIDWYDRPNEEVIERIRSLGVDYYLKTPNERSHPITARLGMEALAEDFFQLLFEEGDLKLYRMRD